MRASISINPHLRLLKNLRNAEHFDLMEYIDTILSAFSIWPAGLAPAWNTFHTAFGKEDHIYKRAARSADTSRIIAAHERRNKSYMAIRHILEAASYSIVSTIKEAADMLLEMMDNYKGAYSEPMNEVSALYTNLIHDFAKPAYTASLTLIPGATDAVARLNEDNEIFKTIYHTRAQDREEMKEKGTLRNARKETDQAFAALVEDINAFYHINEILGNAGNLELGDTLRSIITDINAYLHQHQMTYVRRCPKYRTEKDKPGEEAGSDVNEALLYEELLP
jgi:hypothetical protein